MNEDTVRALLTRVAEGPEPLPSRIDVDAARRAGRRRQRAGRVAIPAAVCAVVLAAAAIVNVPRAVSPQAERIVPPAAPTSSAPTETAFKTAPAHFDPLTVDASFGWLPAGYSQERFGHGNPQAVFANTFRLTTGAMSAKGAGISLTVNARARLDETGITVSPAPAVNGRTAYWAAGGIAWEWSTGGWAELTAGGLTRAELEKIASHVTIGAGAPYHFFFQVSSLPVGWHVNDVYSTYIGGRLVATDVELIDKKLLNVVDIDATPAPGGCNISARPGVRFVQWGGVKWAFWVDQYSPMFCATAPVNGLGSAWLTKGVPVQESTSSLLYGLTIFLKLVTFRGASPADWATSFYGKVVVTPPAPRDYWWAVEAGAAVLAGLTALYAGLGWRRRDWRDRGYDEQQL